MALVEEDAGAGDQSLTRPLSTPDVWRARTCGLTGSVVCHCYPLAQWDHVEFPGPLSRSFVPALMLSLPVKLSLAVAQLLGLEVDKFGVQILGAISDGSQ